jgi:hypothetical protein
MTAVEVAAIESYCIPGQKSANETGKIGTVAAEQKVEMIRNEHQAKQSVPVFISSALGRRKKLRRSSSSRKISERSTPLTMTCYKRSGMSILECLGMS